jgi:pSer/pThr/pTyr-binding forkhead associated (FHA) protein
VPLPEAEDSPPVVPIPITANVVTFGRDAVRATLVLEDVSVEEIHARLQRENNLYRLVDAGSVAGTWVNYTPVSRDGTLLENGDFIHIGRIGFRFIQRESGHVRKPVVLPQPAKLEARR